MKIVVLGATGMLGRVVHAYLKKEIESVWGTSRKRGHFFHFGLNDPENDLRAIEKKIGKIDFVINCIGLIQSYHRKGMEPAKEDYITINSLLPHKLDALASEYGFRLIHVSTNAVFPMNIRANESTSPHPESIYGMSKFLGEPESKHSLTIRTSFVGCDPMEKKGLVELVRKGKEVSGFTNQKFLGCTTLQFACFIYEIIISNRFKKLREISPVFHFFPIQGISKYRLLSEISKLLSRGIVKPATASQRITQSLVTKFEKELILSEYDEPLRTALQEMFEFEKEI